MNGPALFAISLGLLILSLILFLPGFSMSDWLRTVIERPLTYGIWTICSPELCYTIDAYFGGSPGGHVYFARFTGICQLGGTVVALCFLFLFSFRSPRKNWAQAAYSTALAIGIMGFVGAVIFLGREKTSDLVQGVQVSWGGIVVIMAALMQTAAGICVFLPVHRGQVSYEQS